MEKILTIKYNIITGDTNYDTEDEFSPVELLGILETIKTLVINDIINNNIE